MYIYEKIFCCEYCDYKTLKKYNVTRHTVIKHIDTGEVPANQKNNPDNQKNNPDNQKNNPDNQKNNPDNQKNNPDNQKNNPDNQKNNPWDLHENQCDKCGKILSNNQNLRRHIKICNGKMNPLQCTVCKEIFTLPQAKYRHQRKCMEKQEEEEERQLTVQNNTTTNNNAANNANNVNSNNNNVNSNNITNNNIKISLFIDDKYHKDYKKDQGFIIDESMHKEIANIVKKYYPHCDEIAKRFNRLILSKPENQIIRKTNLRSSHSIVNRGDKWNHIIDSYAYQHMISCLCHSLMYYIKGNDKFTDYIYALITDYAKYISDGGYNKDSEDMEEQKDLQNDYKKIEKDCITTVYNYTKPERANTDVPLC